jgi:hypothetical protein
VSSVPATAAVVTPAPLLSGAPPPRVRVRDALRELVGSGEWPFPSWTVLQNRVLDEVGSDLRPLVALLVRAGEAGLLEQMPASRAGWPAVRGALMVSLTAHTFLQPEMARWAVECWGYALGVATEADLTVAADPRVAPPAPAPPSDHPLRSVASAPAPASAPPPGTRTAGSPRPAPGGGGVPRPVAPPVAASASGPRPGAGPTLAPGAHAPASRPHGAWLAPSPRPPGGRRGLLPRGSTIPSPARRSQASPSSPGTYF